MKNYYKIMLGKKSVYADDCYKEGFIGADFGIDEDLTVKLPEDWRQFNQKYIPMRCFASRATAPRPMPVRMETIKIQTTEQGLQVYK